jgi:protein-S-isoprenylcysteine O-methyltransferase Ste14
VFFFLQLVYQITALLCLRHWRSATPWRDLDFFSASFFVLTAVLLAYHIRFNRGILESQEALREASGSTFDPATLRRGSMLAIADLSVFLDYGHWHLTPALRTPGLQITGLLLYGCAVAGLMWTDTRLVRHFQGDLHRRQLMTTGPFAVVRHPRYASLLLAKLGITLLFASVFGWMSLLLSVLLIRRRIRLEEIHLLEIFGPDYPRYTARRARLVPGIY